MGYTIYWKTKTPVSREEVVKIVEAIRKLIREHPDIVATDFKEKKNNNKFNINFNGLGEEAYETFTFYTDYTDNLKQDIYNSLTNHENERAEDILTTAGNLKFCCCKTAREPYDMIVKSALIKMQEITDNKFEITCDDGFEYFKDKIIKKDSKGKETIWAQWNENEDPLHFLDTHTGGKNA